MVSAKSKIPIPKPELSGTTTSLLGSQIVDNPTDRELYIPCPNC
jgi:hypothetical protein